MRHVAAAGFQVGEDRCGGGRLVEIFQRECGSGLRRDGQQVQHRIGGAAAGGNGGSGVTEGVPRQEGSWRHLPVRQIDRPPPAPFGLDLLMRIGCGHIVGAHRRQAQHAQRHRHGVGGELAAAGARAGAGGAFQCMQFLGGHAAGGSLPHGLEHILDGDVAILESSGGDRSAIENQSRHVEAGQRHGGGGNGLVAAHQHHDAVQTMAAHHQFDGIGDHLA